MMKITIIKSDGAVYKNNTAYTGLDLPSIPDNVTALQFDAETNTGHIEFDTSIPNEDITTLPSWAVECLSVWDRKDYAIKNPPAPTPEELIILCKSEAVYRLSETDWVELPSVSDVTINPHLINITDFITYRNIIRQYAVNPVATPIWPIKPNAIWSA